MVLRLGGETNKDLAVFRAAKLVENVPGRLKLEHEIGSFLFYFLRRHGFWAEIQRRRRLDHHVGVRGIVENSIPHLLCRTDVDRVGKLKSGWARNKHHFRSTIARG